jgi:hypothetical protein
MVKLVQVFEQLKTREVESQISFSNSFELGSKQLIFVFPQVPVKSGKYSMNLEDGDYTCICIFKGFFSYYNPYCSVKGGLKKSIDMVMSPIVGPGTIRIILTWNDKVNDLDAYLMAP